MSSVRIVNVEVVAPNHGVCRLICDWNKDAPFSTGVAYQGHGVERVQKHATLAAALGRLSRVAKGMKI